MKVSVKGREFIAQHEGIRTKAYRDSVGVWTIGIGHTANAGPPAPKKGMVISRAEVMDIFARDLAKFEKRVDKALGSVPQHVFDGAVSFDFNTGGIHKASWVKHYKAGDMAAARKSFMNWSKPPEIIGRRTHERDLVFDGDYGNVRVPAPAPNPPPKPEIVQPTGFSAELAVLQDDLLELGYSQVGKVDGRWGNLTRGALLAFKGDWNADHPDKPLPMNEDWRDADVRDALIDAKPRPLSEARKNATVKDLREEGSRTIAATDGIKGVGGVVVAGGAVAGAVEESGVLDAVKQAGETAQTVTDAVSPFQSLLAIIGDYWWIGAMGLGGFALYFGIKAARARLDDHRNARTV